VGPQNPKDVARDIARDLSGMAGEPASLKGDAYQWLEGPEYEAVRHRLEIAHAGAKTATKAYSTLQRFRHEWSGEFWHNSRQICHK
jgi:hypothetical protein